MTEEEVKKYQKRLHSIYNRLSINSDSKVQNLDRIPRELWSAMWSGETGDTILHDVKPYDGSRYFEERNWFRSKLNDAITLLIKIDEALEKKYQSSIDKLSRPNYEFLDDLPF